MVAVVISVVVDVVTLTLMVDVLLLLPAVEEDLEDAEGAKGADEPVDNHSDDYHGVDPVNALLAVVVVVVVFIVVVEAPVGFPVASEGVDD